MTQAAPISVTIASATPAWYSSATLSQWKQITGGPAPRLMDVNTAGNTNQIAVFIAFNGAVASRSSLILNPNGGHTDYAGNEVYEYRFDLDVPQFFRRTDASTNTPVQLNNALSSGYYPDGLPMARHTYNNGCYIGPLTGSSNGERTFHPFGFAVYGDGNSHTKKGCSYSRLNQTYDPAGTYPDWPSSTDPGNMFKSVVSYDATTETVWTNGGYGGSMEVSSMNARTRVWTNNYSGKTNPNINGLVNSAIDPIRKLHVMSVQGGQIIVIDIARPNDNVKVYNVAGLPDMQGNGFVFEPVGRKFVWWDGGKTIYVCSPPANARTGDGSTANPLNATATYSVTAVTPAGGATPSNGSANGTYGKFNYIEYPPCLCVIGDQGPSDTPADEFMYAYPIPTAGL